MEVGLPHVIVGGNGQIAPQERVIGDWAPDLLPTTDPPPESELTIPASETGLSRPQRDAETLDDIGGGNGKIGMIGEWMEWVRVVPPQGRVLVTPECQGCPQLQDAHQPLPNRN